MADTYVWAACPRCGKERQVLARGGTEFHESYAAIGRLTMCIACAQDFGIERDTCPEQVWTPGTTEGAGLVPCSLERHHSGQCVPLFAADDIQTVMVYARAVDQNRERFIADGRS